MDKNKMEQFGNNSVQIGEISGGEPHFHFYSESLGNYDKNTNKKMSTVTIFLASSVNEFAFDRLRVSDFINSNFAHEKPVLNVNL